MATKNMARTVIEGGRYSYNKSDRYESNRDHRAETRQYMHAVQAEDVADAKPEPKRRKVSKEFSDKLRPMYRWLAKQLGRRWDKVYAELVQKFDTRTTAGRHVVHDHLLSSITLQTTDVVGHSPTVWRNGGYYVDACGILVKQASRRRPSQAGLTDVHKWADSRYVIDHGTSRFWMVPERWTWMECNLRAQTHWSAKICYKAHRISTKTVRVDNPLAIDKPSLLSEEIDGEIRYYKIVEIEACKQGVGNLRQGPRLSEEDEAMWASLNDLTKDKIRWPRPPGRPSRYL